MKKHAIKVIALALATTLGLCAFAFADQADAATLTSPHRLKSKAGALTVKNYSNGTKTSWKSQVVSSNIVLAPGETSQLSVTGVSGSPKITYYSKNTSVVTVSSTGLLKAIGVGETKVYAKYTSKGKTVTCKRVVSVGPKKGVGAVRWAAAFTPCNYSLNNRMGKNSVDCSSLVGRAYLSQNLSMSGFADGAPLSAGGQAQWCVMKGHLVAWGLPALSTMLVGDTIYQHTGYADYGDYLGIDGTELYAGDGNVITWNESVHKGWLDGSTVKLVGRPAMACYPEITAPKSISVKKYASKKVKVAWTKKSNVKVRVYRATSATGKFKRVSTCRTGSKWIDTNISKSKKRTYYYKIRYYVKSSTKTFYSPYSPVASIKI